MTRFRWALFLFAGIILLAGSSLLAHDPRTTSKDFSTGMIVGGAGKLEITYKGMHWNAPSYERAMANEKFRDTMNKNVWHALGKAHLDFKVIVGDKEIPKGDYTFGILLEPDRKFSLSLANATSAVTVPLEATFDNPDHPYLSLDITPADASAKPELYVLEARCGQFRAIQSIKVPYLMEHTHPGEATKTKTADTTKIKSPVTAKPKAPAVSKAPAEQSKQ